MTGGAWEFGPGERWCYRLLALAVFVVVILTT
jgi:hypothetical protein